MGQMNTDQLPSLTNKNCIQASLSPDLCLKTNIREIVSYREAIFKYVQIFRLTLALIIRRLIEERHYNL